MKTDEHVVLDIDTYDDLKSQNREFKESEKEYIAQIKLLQDREVVATFGTVSNGFSNWITSAKIITDDEMIKATFDELKDQHKAQIDKLMNRNIWQRILNRKP